MDRIVDGLDSPRGVVAFVVVVSLVAGFMIAFSGILAGEPEYAVHFVAFASLFVAVVVSSFLGWSQLHRAKSE